MAQEVTTRAIDEVDARFRGNDKYGSVLNSPDGAGLDWILTPALDVGKGDPRVPALLVDRDCRGREV